MILSTDILGNGHHDWRRCSAKTIASITRSVFKLLKLGHFIVDHSPDVLVLDETPAEEMHCQGGEGMEKPGESVCDAANDQLDFYTAFLQIYF